MRFRLPLLAISSWRRSCRREQVAHRHVGRWPALADMRVPARAVGGGLATVVKLARVSWPACYSRAQMSSTVATSVVMEVMSQSPDRTGQRRTGKVRR